MTEIPKKAPGPRCPRSGRAVRRGKHFKSARAFSSVGHDSGLQDLQDDLLPERIGDGVWMGREESRFRCAIRVRTDSPGRLELLRRGLLEAEKQKSQTHNNKDAVMSSHSEEQQFMGFLGCCTVSEVE